MMEFQNQKSQRLEHVDLSKKGSVDEPILELVSFINSLPNYFTTSSCSGRIILFESAVENVDDNPSIDKEVSIPMKIGKKGCKWLFVSHSSVMSDEQDHSFSKASGCSGNAVFKFEAMVMHIQCKTLEDAQKMHQAAMAAGFRNSGISVGGKRKIILIWDNISGHMHAVCGTKRDKDDLKKRWKDLKSAALKFLAHQRGTGGGPPIKESPYTQAVLDVLGAGTSLVDGINVCGTDSYTDNYTAVSECEVIPPGSVVFTLDEGSDNGPIEAYFMESKPFPDPDTVHPEPDTVSPEPITVPHEPVTVPSEHKPVMPLPSPSPSPKERKRIEQENEILRNEYFVSAIELNKAKTEVAINQKEYYRTQSELAIVQKEYYMAKLAALRS